MRKVPAERGVVSRTKEVFHGLVSASRCCIPEATLLYVAHKRCLLL